MKVYKMGETDVSIWHQFFQLLCILKEFLQLTAVHILVSLIATICLQISFFLSFFELQECRGEGGPFCPQTSMGHLLG